MTTHHTSGAADLPEALDAIADSQYLAGVAAGWNAAQASDPNAALRKIHESRAGYLKPLRDAQLAALAAGQAVAPAELTPEQIEAMPVWRNFVGLWPESRQEIVRAVEEMLNNRPPPPAMDDPGPFLEDDGRAMVGSSHHYTADNIRALVAEYKALESGAPEAVERYSNSDHRTRAGVLWRVISALADEVPFAPAMDGGDAEDAKRYRWLRDGTVVDGAINDELYVHVDSSAYPGRWALVGAELDAAVDAARAAQKEGEKP